MLVCCMHIGPRLDGYVYTNRDYRPCYEDCKIIENISCSILNYLALSQLRFVILGHQASVRLVHIDTISYCMGHTTHCVLIPVVPRIMSLIMTRI